MHQLIACMFCGGMDPNADSLLLQAAIAGGITTPWMLRNQLRALIKRLRGDRTADDVDAACPLPYDEDGEPPTSHR
ncbi:MAG TPA: hypothetical protein VGQ66_00775 [Candidatus Limnocylindria bacterium]|jgi:uncharacterized protein YgfB (UPF0149 family)|nr:hypothetical protein [Candidatus Limnocylindria bacterium]